jgi:hypothetical protein
MRFAYLIFILVAWTTTFAQENTARSTKVKAAPGVQEARELTIEVSDSVGFFLALKQYSPHTVVLRRRQNIYTLTKLTKDNVRWILSHEAVRYADRGRRIAKEETVLGDFDFSANHITALQSLYPALNGNGVTLSVKEKPFDQNDIDLAGRTIFSDQFDEPASLHATIMATIAAGAGNSTPLAHGAAWAAMLSTSDFENLLPDPDQIFAEQNIPVQNHSYGVGLENYYGLESKEYDRQTQDIPFLLHVFSSGNQGEGTPAEGMYSGVSGFANLTGQFKTSKNTLTVGSADRSGVVASRSSRGPAYDGRVKPELVAFGDAGSSEAAAVVSGVSAVLHQAYLDKTGVRADAALIKGLLINSADDTGSPNVDYVTGFGNVSAIGAVRSLLHETYASGVVATGEYKSHDIAVPAGASILKVTLIWADAPAEPFNDKALVNDIDLTVTDPSGAVTFLPWVLNPSPSTDALTAPAQRGADHLNNVEQVTIENPAEGIYAVNVSGFDVPSGTQKYYIVYEVRSGFEWLNPPVNAMGWIAGDIAFLRWSWNDAAQSNASIYYKGDQESEWTLITDSADPAARSHQWQVPAYSGVVTFRFIVGGQSFDSGPVVISNAPQVGVGYRCDDGLMLHWNRVEGASQYQLLQMGEKYLEPLRVVSDTFTILSPDQNTSLFYSVTPLFGDAEGPRSLTINYLFQGVDCYVVSFVPEENIVTGAAKFNVVLGTVYDLSSAVLERKEGNTFIEVSDASPVTGTHFQLADENPLEGTVAYRLRVTTGRGIVATTDEVLITFIPRSSLYIFPNPVYAGDDVNLISASDDVASIVVIDGFGRILGKAEDFGRQKTFNTATLISGFYLVRVQHLDGRVVTGRLIIR